MKGSGGEAVGLNLAAWRRGELEPPGWCCYGGDREKGEYCWTWVCGYEATRAGCADCEFCLGRNGPDVWRPLNSVVAS